ncbi:hypothetical protein [Neolewinella sp.]|uniref:hypothetical protein n=1 Tax=Neolewinella sp. TaxID=2993543 RepID=UPI003B526F2B
MNNTQRQVFVSLYALPVSIILALIVGPILRDGMFIDGLVYTNLAKNIYQGVGSFWAPLVDTGGPVFYDHPPLLPYLESLFFHLFGNHRHTEDIYNATVFGLTVFFMYRIWVSAAGKSNRSHFFFPLLLFALSQEVQLRYPNAMLECGMTLVLLVFTFLYLRWYPRRPVVATLLAGVGAFFAFLCKGPVGLFLLGLPLLHALLVERRRYTGAILLPLLSMGMCFGALFLLEPAAFEFTRHYLDQQVLSALLGERIENVAASRLAILWSLINTNIPAILLCLLLLRVRRTRDSAHWHQLGYMFVLVGATAILPIVVSIKQAAYYQIPSLPYLFIGLSLLLLPRLKQVVQFLYSSLATRRALTSIASVGIVTTTYVALSMLGTTDRRDVEALAQAERIAAIMDSLGTTRYNLIVTGERAAFNTALSYTVTGSLNRWYDVYEDRTKKADVDLIIRTSKEQLLPPSNDDDMLFLRNNVSLTLAK